MKVISLNIWGGKEFGSLMNYVSDNINNTDIFFFQEVYDAPSGIVVEGKDFRSNVFDELKKVLS
ncbi:MAG: hypothetical protein KJ592_01770, partial [Nanoarchaeota archaeon]|nr:hypothetical protein [Nanoarchaeota archaeon]